jgi:hypothetical protein
MKSLLDLGTRDSWDVLVRSFMETRDLPLTFRFDDDGIRNTIRTWFKGLNDSTWRARHQKTEEFVKKIGAATPSSENAGVLSPRFPIQRFMRQNAQPI